MTQTQTESSRRYTRRGVMRRTALGIGAAATLGGAASTSVAAVDWETAGKFAATALIGGPAAAGAVAYGAIIDGPDESEVASSLEWQSHVDEFTRSIEDNLALDQTLASLKRDVQLVGNKAREEAIFRVYEQAVDGGTTTTATDAAQTAIDNAYATVEEAILDSWAIRFNRALTVVDDLFAGLIDSDAVQTRSNDGNLQSGGNYGALTNNRTDANWTLYDGSTITVPEVLYDGSPPIWLTPDSTQTINTGDHTQVELVKPDPANYASQDEPLDISQELTILLDSLEWRDIMSDLETEYQALSGEVSSIVDTYFQPAKDGNYDLTDLRGPAHLTNTAKNAGDFQEATMALRAMGFSIADQTSVVSFKQDGTTYELDGRLARTVQDPNDLPVGSELNPSNITGSVYGAFNIQNDAGERVGEIFEITNPFTIETAEGKSSVSFQTRTLVGSDSTLTNEEIQQIFAENYEANKDATENVYDTATTSTSGGGGGGGGFLANSDQNWGLIAAGAGVAAIGWGYITGDDQ